MSVSKKRRKKKFLELVTSLNNPLSQSDTTEGNALLLATAPKDITVQCIIRDWQIKPITTAMAKKIEGDNVTISSLQLSQVSRIAESAYGRGSLMLEVKTNSLGFVPLTSLTERQHGLQVLMSAYDLKEEFLLLDPHEAMEFYNPHRRQTLTRTCIFKANSNVDVKGVARFP